MDALNEKKKTATNSTGDIFEARVIANYGDPGLDEDFHFDILSRYVIVILESAYRIPTSDKWFRMLAIVKRPQQLWINTTGGVSSNPTTQNRADADGNVNVGLAANYSVAGIQRINTPYALGESIKIKKLASPLTQANNLSFFQSDFTTWDSTNWSYAGWHTQGASLPYINNDPNKTASLRLQTLAPTPSTSAGTFNFSLNKLQYEAFMLTISDPSLTANITQVFQGQWNSGTPVYTVHGGYLFQNVGSQQLFSCEYEDINVGNKMRIGTSECVPLIVTTPDSFPTPKTRQIGTIAYTPSYSPIQR